MENIITGLIPNISISSIINFIIWTLGIVIILVIAGTYIALKIYNKRYQEYKVVIYEKDSTGNIHEHYDQAGVFLNKKTGFKLLFFKKLKKGLNPNNVPYTIAKTKDGKLQKIIYIIRTGVSNYRFCHLKIHNENITFTIGEEDVNWAEQEYESIVKTFDKKGFLEKYGGMLIFAFTVVIILILLIVLFNKFPILQQTAEAQLKSLEIQQQILADLKNISVVRSYPGEITTPIITPK